MGRSGLDSVSVSSHFMFQVFRSCHDLGARKPVLLAALDLTDAQLRDPRIRFGADALATLCQATAQELGRENAFLDIGWGMTPTGFSDVGYMALFEETIGGVLQAAAAAMDSRANKPLLRWEQSGSICRLVADPGCNAAEELIFVLFSVLSRIGRIVANDESEPTKAAYFVNRQPRNCNVPKTLENHRITIPCFFDQRRTCLELHGDIADLPNPFANRDLVRAGQHLSNRFPMNANEPTSLVALSYHYLSQLLDKSGLSLDAAAETFGMAERTLRRKLAAEGASFRQILEEVRRDTCHLYFLEGTRSLSEIATKLGYSELSAFTRAYTAWYGRSPSRDMAVQMAVTDNEKSKFSGKMVGVERVELPTPSMSTKCSTTELYAHAAGRLASR